MSEWWQPASGTFSRDMARFLFSPGRVKAAAAEAAGIKAFFKLRRGATVLDAACGTGRHSLALARLGLALTGVDVTPGYVRAAARQAKAEGLTARFAVGELRDLRRYAGSADLVMNFFNSFGYYRRDADNQASLAQMAAALKPGGRLLLDLTPRENLLPHFIPRDWGEADGAYLMERRAWMDGRRRIRTDYVLCVDGRVSRGGFDLRIYTLAQLKAMMARAGLGRVRAYGDLRGRPWRPGQRLFLLGAR